jgi:hypothetical protein
VPLSRDWLGVTSFVIESVRSDHSREGDVANRPRQRPARPRRVAGRARDWIPLARSHEPPAAASARDATTPEHRLRDDGAELSTGWVPELWYVDDDDLEWGEWVSLFARAAEADAADERLARRAPRSAS